MRAREVLRKAYNPQCYGDPCPACDEGVDRIIAALRAAGFEIAPREATEPMLKAMENADDCGYSAPCRTNYGAMFVAAISAAKEQT